VRPSAVDQPVHRVDPRVHRRALHLRLDALPPRSDPVLRQVGRRPDVVPTRRGAEDPDIDNVVHRHLGLAAEAVGAELSSLDLQRHPEAPLGGGRNGGSPGAVVVQRDVLEHVRQHAVQRVRGGGAQVRVQFQRGGVRRLLEADPFQKFAQRSVQPLFPEVVAQRVRAVGVRLGQVADAEFHGREPGW
jgi:hypothetical protein